mgnify:CR=1 FL=1
MGVTLHPPANPKRFRISRTWKNQAYQLYVPISGNVEKARRIAEELDESLASRQRAYILRLQTEGLHVMHPDGRIIGLQRQTRFREGRKPSDSMKIRLVKEEGQKPVFKAFSVDHHGFDKAFQMAVDFIAEFREVEQGSDLYKRMLSAKPVYAEMVPENKQPSKPAEANPDHAALWAMLEDEVKAFQERRNVRVIRG